MGLKHHCIDAKIRPTCHPSHPLSTYTDTRAKPDKHNRAAMQ